MLFLPIKHNLLKIIFNLHFSNIITGFQQKNNQIKNPKSNRVMARDVSKNRRYTAAAKNQLSTMVSELTWKSRGCCRGWNYSRTLSKRILPPFCHNTMYGIFRSANMPAATPRRKCSNARWHCIPWAVYHLYCRRSTSHHFPARGWEPCPACRTKPRKPVYLCTTWLDYSKYIGLRRFCLRW